MAEGHKPQPYPKHRLPIWEMKTKRLQLDEIVTTAGTQIRARIDTDTVDEYALAMRDSNNEFPPVVVFHDGNQFILADGFHRVVAAARNGFRDIASQVEKGTRSDALKFALGANTAHGLKRTNADKRRCVELALAEWPKLSSSKISELCCVHRSTVDEIRAQHAESACSEPTKRVGADGKERRMPRRSEPEPEPEKPRVKSAEEILETQIEAPEREATYHLELVKADIELILEKIRLHDFSAADLLDVIAEFGQAVQKLKTLHRHAQQSGGAL